MDKNKGKEKVYITRNEDSDKIWVWFKPLRGNWSPSQLKDCDVVNYQREDIDAADCYSVDDFKKKFGVTIREKSKKCIHLSSKLLRNEDYKLFSNDPKRKR